MSRRVRWIAIRTALFRQIMSMARVEPSRSVESGRAAVQGSYIVFLGHSSEDTWIASRIAESIRQKGGEVWLDTNELAGGDIIYGEIIEAIDACDEAVILLSPYSLDSEWVLFEMGAICGQHKRITPLRVHVEQKDVPCISGVRGIDINHIEQTLLPELGRRIAEKAQGDRSREKTNKFVKERSGTPGPPRGPIHPPAARTDAGSVNPRES